jgi:hypothetical protein
MFTELLRAIYSQRAWLRADVLLLLGFVLTLLLLLLLPMLLLVLLLQGAVQLSHWCQHTHQHGLHGAPAGRWLQLLCFPHCPLASCRYNSYLPSTSLSISCV